MKPAKIATFVSILLFLTSAAPYVLGQSAKFPSGSLTEPHHQADIPGLLHTWYRRWDKGYLVSWGSHDGDDASPTEPSVVLYDRNGHIARKGIVWLREASKVGISDVAVNRSGDLIVAGGTENGAGVIANFIAAIGSDSRVSKVIRTPPFLPVYVCAAEDGTVWSYGFDRDEEGRRVENSLMLRQFSFDKGQVRAVADKTALDSGGWVLDHGRYLGEISLRCTSQKVVLYNGGSGDWLEFDTSVNTLKVAKVSLMPSPKEIRITGFAVTDSGDVFASMHDRSSVPPRSGLFKLEFDGARSGSWVPVKNTVAPYLKGPIERLLGTDGTNLVYTRDFEGTAYWSRFTK